MKWMRVLLTHKSIWTLNVMILCKWQFNTLCPDGSTGFCNHLSNNSCIIYSQLVLKLIFKHVNILTVSGLKDCTTILKTNNDLTKSPYYTYNQYKVNFSTWFKVWTYIYLMQINNDIHKCYFAYVDLYKYSNPSLIHPRLIGPPG